MPKKSESHGLKHNGTIEGMYTAETRGDPEWVYLLYKGEEFARQSKQSSGRFHRQGTNPDYEGYLGYRLQYKRDGKWCSYDEQAARRAIVHLVQRLAASAGVG